MANRIETITEILHNISELMCNDYCKYRKQKQFDDDSDWVYEEIDSPCDNCPLNHI